MIRNTLTRLLHNWPLKVGAFVLATLIWLFVASSDTETVQSTVSIPITTEGVAANQVAIGLPDVVFVTVSGEARRVERLRPENLEALLDLSNVQGNFERTVDVQGPRDIAIVAWEPRVVTGQLETVTSKSVPVTVVVLGTAPGAALSANATPQQVTATGPSGPLGRVSQVLAATPPEAGEHELALFPADADGLPVRDVSLEPNRVSVAVVSRPLMEIGVAEVVLVPPELPTLIDARLDRDTIAVMASAEVLAGLPPLEATVELTTPMPAAGQYTLPVTLALPAGVAALEIPTATLRFGRAPIDR